MSEGPGYPGGIQEIGYVRGWVLTPPLLTPSGGHHTYGRHAGGIHPYWNSPFIGCMLFFTGAFPTEDHYYSHALRN